MTTTAIIVTVLSVVLAVLLALKMIPLLVWLERRGAGFIQDRPGPNRANVFGFRLAGIVQSVADVVKLVFKEEYYPGHIKSGRWLYVIAPSIAFAAAFLAFMVVPFADNLTIGDETFRIQALPVDWGVVWFMAIGSVGILGVTFGGWLSHNKYSLLGSLRAGSQLLGYELPLGLSIIIMVITYQTIDFNAMVQWQTGTYLGFLPAWGVIVQPLACIIFTVAMFAETNRAPFNCVEGESEIVAGHMVEYSAMKFALYFMGEYIAMNTASAVIITMFFGGYQLPYLSTADLANNFTAVGSVLLVIIPVSLFIFIKWMLKNNTVGSAVSTDGGRAFEAKVFMIVFIVFGVILEGITLYLVTQPISGDAVNIAITLLQIGIFIFKLMLFNLLFVVVRWTLPRFRYDQVQTIGWYYLIPLSLVNIFVTAIILVGVK